MLDLLNLQPDAFGLDISDTSVKAARLKRSGDGFSLAAFAEQPLPSKVVHEGQVLRQRELVAAVSKAVMRMGARHAVVSLPEERAFLQVIQLPVMERQSVAMAARHEAENYVPYSVDTVYLDALAVEPLKDHLDHTDALLAALPKSTVDSYLQAVKEAGVLPLALEIESLAIARALVKGGVTEEPVLLMDMGASRTSFVVWAGTAPRFTVTIPISAGLLTRRVAETLKVAEPEAERLKRTHGLLDRKGKVFEALAGPMGDLVEQIERHAGFYESHAEHQHLTEPRRKIQTVLLSGGGANLRGLPEFLAEQLGRRVRVADPWVNILSVPPKEIPELSFEESLRYATALGLALRGVAHD